MPQIKVQLVPPLTADYIAIASPGVSIVDGIIEGEGWVDHRNSCVILSCGEDEEGVLAIPFVHVLAIRMPRPQMKLT